MQHLLLLTVTNILNVSSFFSVLTEGTDCPIGVYLPDTDTYRFTFLSELSPDHCLHALQMDKNVLNYTQGCPTGFWWKGRTSAPSGDLPVSHSHISTAGLVIACLLTFLELLSVIFFLITTIVWRNNM